MKAKKSLNKSQKVNPSTIEMSAVVQTERDFKDAVLMVSVFANLFVLCLWIALQTTSVYDVDLVDFFINR